MHAAVDAIGSHQWPPPHKTSLTCTELPDTSYMGQMTLHSFPALGIMSEQFTSHSEGHQGSDLPLEAVGGDAGVVAGIAAGDFGEVELTVPLVHMRWQLSPIYRGRHRHKGISRWG